MLTSLFVVFNVVKSVIARSVATVAIYLQP